MRVAVLSLTRDRLAFTQHCFASLAANAGCEYDHFVLDQGSTDGTTDWLSEEYASIRFVDCGENIGISNGMNVLLHMIDRDDPYDVVVKVDNDCEIVTPNTLRDICELVDEFGMLLSPQILGLRQPPPTLGTPLALDAALVDEKRQIGGIFLAAPASLYDDGFRFSESNPLWGGDDVEVCAHWRNQGGMCGYVRGYEAWHYQTTNGQAEMYPEYFQRRVLEGGPAL